MSQSRRRFPRGAVFAERGVELDLPGSGPAALMAAGLMLYFGLLWFRGEDITIIEAFGVESERAFIVIAVVLLWAIAWTSALWAKVRGYVACMYVSEVPEGLMIGTFIKCLLRIGVKVADGGTVEISNEKPGHRNRSAGVGAPLSWIISTGGSKQSMLTGFPLKETHVEDLQRYLSEGNTGVRAHYRDQAHEGEYDGE